MSPGGEIVFLICGTLALVSAVLTVSLKSPLRAAMALLGHVLSLSGLYLTLQAHLLAAVQLIVYAGAVVVLFVFVIMLMGPSATLESKDSRGLIVKTVGASLMAMVGAVIAFGVANVSRPYVDSNQCAPGIAECGQFGGVEAVANALFLDHAVPFELVSVLLLVAIIASIAVARGHTPEQKEALEERRRAAEAKSSAAG